MRPAPAVSCVPRMFVIACLPTVTFGRLSAPVWPAAAALWRQA